MRAHLAILKAAFKLQAMMSLDNPLYLLVLIGQPATLAVILYLVYYSSGRSDYLEFVILGAGLTGLWNATLWSCGFIVERERRFGTLELMMMSPSSLLTILFGKSLANATLSLVSLLVAYLAVFLVFRVSLLIRLPMLFLGSLLLSVLAMTAVGLLIGLSFALSRSTRRLVEIMGYPVYLLSGLVFPLMFLPRWSRPFSFILPLTWSAVLLRGSVRAEFSYEPALSITALVLLTVIYFALARRVYRTIERLMRWHATMTAY